MNHTAICEQYTHTLHVLSCALAQVVAAQFDALCGYFFVVQDLYKKYSYIRKTRPDGNCFYRAFGFAHLESLLDDSKELQK